MTPRAMLAPAPPPRRRALPPASSRQASGLTPLPPSRSSSHKLQTSRSCSLIFILPHRLGHFQLQMSADAETAATKASPAKKAAAKSPAKATKSPAKATKSPAKAAATKSPAGKGSRKRPAEDDDGGSEDGGAEKPAKKALSDSQKAAYKSFLTRAPPAALGTKEAAVGKSGGGIFGCHHTQALSSQPPPLSPTLLENRRTGLPDRDEIRHHRRAGVVHARAGDAWGQRLCARCGCLHRLNALFFFSTSCSWRT